MVNKLLDVIATHQEKLEAVAIFLLGLAISFRFNARTTWWVWNDYAYIAVLLVMLVVVLAVLWIRIERRKTAALMKAIQETASVPKPTLIDRADSLSDRQKQVVVLIQQGKSNKEIMDELSIELSTLKTHINKIYKILDVDSRKQVKSANRLA